MNINKVENTSGTLIDFDAAVNLMDDSIREKLHNRLAPCSNQRFMTEYEKEHVKVYGEPWELSKENPTY